LNKNASVLYSNTDGCMHVWYDDVDL